jgi:2-polyprenyl-3-methyl-5-hydroxy-6-metoxy-1,4-benzoquinol methylase
MTAAGEQSPCALCGAHDLRPLFAKRGWTFVRCAGCSLVALRPLPSPAEHERHTEASYAHGAYAVFAAADTIRTAIATHRFGIVRRLASAGPWLDVGCSSGAFVAVAAEAGIDVEGLERSPAAVARARSRGLRVHQGTIERFVPIQRYAAITAFDLIEHLGDPVAFVRQAARWLAPDGILAVTVPNIDSLTARLMGRHWFYYAPPEHVHYFRPATLRHLLETGGLRDVIVQPTVKPLSLEYAALALTQFNARLGAVARRAVAALPRALRARLLPIHVGELLATARPPVPTPMAGR